MFSKFYNALYYGVIDEREPAENSYSFSDIGDILITGDPDAVTAFNMRRGDIIASDREAAAYAFYYVYTFQNKALKYISAAAYNKIINIIIKLYNSGII